MCVWVAQLVKRAVLSSGHDLAVREFESHVGPCAVSLEPGAYFRFWVSSLSLPFPSSHSISVSLKSKQRLEKKRVLVDPHPPQHLVFPVFWILAILIDV